VRVLVTGANGFLGSAVVRAASTAGHEVRALIRPAAQPAVDWQPSVDVVRADLRAATDLPDLLAGCDVVVHLAADKTGDLYSQLSNNVVATERLLAAMRTADVHQLVLASSFAVYDPGALPRGGVLDESCPLAADPLSRDAYTTTKLLQERLVREAVERGDIGARVMRAGAVFGPRNFWSARLGQQFGRRWVAVGSRARLPLSYVENCADALVRCAEPSLGLEIINVVDDEQPTQRRLVDEYAKRIAPRPTVLRVPRPVAKSLVVAIDTVNRRLLDGQLLVPGSLKRSTFTARFADVTYSNARLRATGWRQRVSLEQALQLTFAAGT
jgi:nucleoside-diphosphate-sugar epimerase